METLHVAAMLTAFVVIATIAIIVASVHAEVIPGEGVGWAGPGFHGGIGEDKKEVKVGCL